MYGPIIYLFMCFILISCLIFVLYSLQSYLRIISLQTVTGFALVLAIPVCTTLVFGSVL